MTAKGRTMAKFGAQAHIPVTLFRMEGDCDGNQGEPMNHVTFLKRSLQMEHIHPCDLGCLCGGGFCLVCTNALPGGHLLLVASFTSWF